MGRSMLGFVLITSTCQVGSGVILWVLAALDLHINRMSGCREFNAGSIVTGLFQFLAGLSGFALVIKAKGSDGHVKRLLPAIYVVMSAAVVVPIIVHSQSVLCVPALLLTKGPGALTIGIFKLIITYLGFLFSVLAIGFTVTEFCSLRVCHDKSQGPNKSSEEVEPQNNVVTSSTPKKNNRPTLQLPEAKTHQQEAPGSGERVTVVTLPEAEGIVYAVPDEYYVVKKGESTYVTPPGDHRWTKFFPSYKKVDVD